MYDISELPLWHAYFLIWGVTSFIVYFILFRFLWRREEGRKPFPQEIFFEKILGKKYYTLKSLLIGFICCLMTWIAFQEVTNLFIPLVIPAGLLLLRKLFYKYKRVYEMYEKEGFTSELHWKEIVKASLFHFNHWVVFIFVIWFFVIPALYFGYFYFYGIKVAILLAIEYFFIGLATWVCGFGAYRIIYSLGKYFPLKISALYRDKFGGYENLGHLSLWTTVAIAFVPGIALPSVLDLELILTSPPVQVALFWYTFANITIFLSGIYGAHRGMIQSKRKRLIKLSNKITVLEERILAISDVNNEKTADVLTLYALQGIYKTAHNIKEWPLDAPTTTGGFGSAMFPLLFTLVTRLILLYFGITS